MAESIKIKVETVGGMRLNGLPVAVRLKSNRQLISTGTTDRHGEVVVSLSDNRPMEISFDVEPSQITITPQEEAADTELAVGLIVASFGVLGLGIWSLSKL